MRTIGFLLALMVTGCGLGGVNGGADGGVDAGRKRVFATQTTYTGNLGGVDGGDARCTSAAHLAGLGGDWRAWLSDDQVQAPARLSSAGPWVLVGSGAEVFANRTQLAGDPSVVINRDEFGTEADVKAWTGTSAGGTGSGDNCGGWTVSSGSSGTYGDTQGRWTDQGLANCANPASLYCFEE